MTGPAAPRLLKASTSVNAPFPSGPSVRARMTSTNEDRRGQGEAAAEGENDVAADAAPYFAAGPAVASTSAVPVATEPLERARESFAQPHARRKAKLAPHERDIADVAGNVARLASRG